ncbi:MAG: hypothetical protein ACI4J4_05005 [Ruminiclostridium sp.]
MNNKNIAKANAENPTAANIGKISNKEQNPSASVPAPKSNIFTSEGLTLRPHFIGNRPFSEVIADALIQRILPEITA